MLFEEYVKTNKAAFIDKVRLISEHLGINPEWLMAVMYKESRLNEKAVNSTGGATGLIQFMPATAQGLGTTTAALKAMSNVEQLDYVYKYYKPYQNKLTSYPDLYLATFYPAALGKPDSYIIGAKGSKVSSQNPGIDLNKDGEITKGEFYRYCYSGFSPRIQDRLKKKQI